jgi:hypothetical protein
MDMEGRFWVKMKMGECEDGFVYEMRYLYIYYTHTHIK